MLLDFRDLTACVFKQFVVVLQECGIVDGTILEVDDFLQDYKLTVHISQRYVRRLTTCTFIDIFYVVFLHLS